VDVILLKNFLWGGSLICVGNIEGILDMEQQQKITITKRGKKITSLCI
jgi:hypothetical protein